MTNFVIKVQAVKGFDDKMLEPLMQADMFIDEQDVASVREKNPILSRAIDMIEKKMLDEDSQDLTSRDSNNY